MDRKVWIAPNATVVGEVSLGEKVNIWYGAVLRGDSGTITLGEGTNVQDLCILHEKTTLGKNCTVGHGAIVHGAVLGDNCTVGMGSVILSGAVLGDNCMVGAGSLVTGTMNAPDGSLLLGSPARVVRSLTEAEIAHNLHNAENYVLLAQKTFD